MRVARAPWRSASCRLLSWSADAQRERREAWRLLASFRAEPATEIIARRAGEFRRQYRRSHSGIGLGDYLIAATAEVKGYRLGTLNVKHFPMFQGLGPPFAIS